MSGLMFEGDTLNRFGKKFPRPFIEKIILKANSKIDVLISMFFEIPALDEEAESFINQLKMNQDIAFTVSLCSADKFNKAINTGKFLNLARNVSYSRGDVTFTDEDALIHKTVMFSNLFTDSDDIDVQLQNDIFNSEGRRFLKMFSTITFAVQSENYEYVTSFTFNRDTGTAGLANNNYKNSQTSDLTYERIFNPDRTINRSPIQTYEEQSGVFYYQTPLASLQMTYHKTDDFGHKDIINAVGAINQRYSSDESDNISYILSEFSDSPMLFVKIQRALDNFTDKTRVTDIGKLYNEISAYIVQTNPLITSQERLEKRQYSNIKVKDLRREPLPLDTTSRTESTYRSHLRGVSTFMPKPIISRSLIPVVYVPPNAATSRETDSGARGNFIEVPLTPTALAMDDIDINKYFKIVTNGYFFFDYEKALNYKSEISKFLNPYNIAQIFGRGALASYFQIYSFRVTKYVTSEPTEPVASYIYYPQNQTCTKIAMNELFTSANTMLKFEASPGEVTEVPVPAAGAGATVTKLFFYKDREQSYDSLLSQRAFDTLEGLGGYRLACFELNDYENFDNEMAESASRLNRKIEIEINIVDNTMLFYDFFIKDRIQTIRTALKKYKDFADDFCSYNNLDGRFNDFFISAIKNEFEAPYPWEEAPLFYNLFQQMINASYNDRGVRRREATLIDIESTKKRVLEEITLISPNTGTLEDLEIFYDQFDTFIKENLTKGNGLDRGNRIYKPLDEASTSTISDLQNPRIEFFMSREESLLASEIVDTFEVDELLEGVEAAEDRASQAGAAAEQELLAKCQNYQLLWHKRQKNLFHRMEKVLFIATLRKNRQEYHNGLSPRTQDWINFQNDKEREFVAAGCGNLDIGGIGQKSRDRIDPKNDYEKIYEYWVPNSEVDEGHAQVGPWGDRYRKGDEEITMNLFKEYAQID